MKHEFKTWQETMTQDEIDFIHKRFSIECNEYGYCVDNLRACRIWVSSQRRRFRKQESKGCCGSHNFIALKWNWKRWKHDIYLIGFNFGH